MKKIILTLSIFAILLEGEDKFWDKNIEEARNKLKVYGLSECLYQQYKNKVDVNNNVILNDILITNSSYHFMGSGDYFIEQNEETYKTIYDPYKETKAFISKIYPTITERNKRTGEPVVMINCLKIYNSKEFDEFIKKQDEFIEPQETK